MFVANDCCYLGCKRQRCAKIAPLRPALLSLLQTAMLPAAGLLLLLAAD